MKRVVLFLLLTVLVAPHPALAQAPSAPAVDATKLGVSLDRIRRELVEAEVREQSGNDGLKVKFHVDVYGQAPKIDVLSNFPLTGPVPYGGPTHRDVVDFLTPQEFRSPVVPFSTLAFWAAQKLAARSKKQRCEDELAEYRLLVMQGVQVAAPRCTQ